MKAFFKYVGVALIAMIVVLAFAIMSIPSAPQIIPGDYLVLCRNTPTPIHSIIRPIISGDTITVITADATELVLYKMDNCAIRQMPPMQSPKAQPQSLELTV